MTDTARIAHGLAEFVRGDLMPVVPDLPLRIALGTIARMVELNPATLDRFLQTPAIAMVVSHDDTGYDIMPVLDALSDTMRSTGSLPVTIPPIPLLTKGETTLTFTATDLDRLRQHIGG